MKKEEFVREFKDIIVEWSKLHERELLNFKSYRWKGKTYEESIRLRNELEEAIKLSRQRNNGGIDLVTADKIYLWGFNQKFPLRSKQEVIEVTRESFRFLDVGDCRQACKTTMRITGKYPHPAGATKILGLSNQEKFCIYDSRVGNALKDLTIHGKKIILCPSSRTVVGDYVPLNIAAHVWSENYEKLIWMMEIIRDRISESAYNLRIADLEIALFMMGRRGAWGYL